MNITTIGIDLAKNTFSVHGVDAWATGDISKGINGISYPVVLIDQPTSVDATP